ncbi:MAG: phosphoenolpyruvate kinase [Myxococcales bacterium]|nr:phosphoenolpyruvate kinase [Myxococcales bacterium]MCB9736792.1 phosphoenolpyruvate kinase [Deltaproteobacteria bacterium]
METTFDDALLSSVKHRLEAANRAYAALYPGEPPTRQPVHTVYGGAHIFKAGTAAKLGQIGLGTLTAYAPDFATFARALELPGHEALPADAAGVAALGRALEAGEETAATAAARLPWLVYKRVVEKLEKEAVEDFRIDFEDGYGNRPHEEEDRDAERAALEVAEGMASGGLPPFVGIRVKPLNAELAERSMRTLDIFLTTLAAKTGGELPNGFVVTLPKVTIPEQVTALVELFALLEAKTALVAGSLKCELMIETPQSIIDAEGRVTIPGLVRAASGRCVACHFGTYDYTASCSVTAAYQAIDHPASDFATHMMQVALGQTGVWMSDGATVVMPIPPHRAAKGGPALTAEQEAENEATVFRAWKLHFHNITHALRRGIYQGWDLHPGQLPIRYAAIYTFFLESLDAASLRLTKFIERAAQATLVGDTFDDAATGQGLLNYFQRALNCGAVDEAELHATGLTKEELHAKSFVAIVENRRS